MEFEYRSIKLHICLYYRTEREKTYNEYRCDKIAGARSTSAVAQFAQT